MSAGTSALAGPEVAAFYSSWLNYSTLKDFAWADKYNPAAAPNRKVCSCPPPFPLAASFLSALWCNMESIALCQLLYAALGL